MSGNLAAVAGVTAGEALRIAGWAAQAEIALVRRDPVAPALLAQAARAADGLPPGAALAAAARLARLADLADPAPGPAACRKVAQALCRLAPSRPGAAALLGPGGGGRGGSPGRRVWWRRPDELGEEASHDAAGHERQDELTSDALRAQVLAANRRFYDAFEALDLDADGGRLGDEPARRLPSPGRPLAQRLGRGARELGDDLRQHELHRVRDRRRARRLVDPVAWVTCVERITTAGGASRRGRGGGHQPLRRRRHRLAPGAAPRVPVLRPAPGSPGRAAGAEG